MLRFLFDVWMTLISKQFRIVNTAMAMIYYFRAFSKKWRMIKYVV